MASSKSHLVVGPAFAVVLILGCCVPSWAAEFAGGTGEPNDPYQIATAEQLIGISSDRTLFDRHFVLVEDIDLDPGLPGRKVFEGPVIEWIVPRTRAGQDSLFHGSFDGGGHAIRNCVIFKTGSGTLAGLFGQITEEGVVRDLHLENMVIIEQSGSGSSNYYCGTLAAVNYGTVIDCSATGTITTYQAGGLIGRNAGIVAQCRADCNVFGSNVSGLIAANDATGRVVLCESAGIVYGDHQAGGLVATNRGTIQYCAVGGYVYGSQAGGLVGENRGWVRESFTTATMVGGQPTGGIAFSNYETVVNCYVTGLMSSYSDGLVVVNQGTIQSSYSTTASQIRPARGTSRRSLSSDLAISSSASGTVRYVYYLDPAKPQGQADSPDSGYGVPLSPEEMKQQASFVGFDFHGDANDGPAGHWFMPPDAYPVLTWQTEITGMTGVPDVSGLQPEQAQLLLEAAGFEPNDVRYDYARLQPISSGEGARLVGAKGEVIAAQPSGYLPAGSPVAIVVSLGEYDFRDNPGDGSETNPYRIATASQLDSLFGRTISEGEHYALTADIDMGAYTYAGGLIAAIAGDFDGNGHTIYALQAGGLFMRVDSSGCVHDLTIEAALLNVPNATLAGMLAGDNNGQILRCKATGSIAGGHSYIGGLVGNNNVTGQLTDCQFSGVIRADSSGTRVGGLVGYNVGAVLRCCARDVDVSGGTYVGGLVGESGTDWAVVQACYATGQVQGVGYVGGLVGRNGIAPVRYGRSIAIAAQIGTSADPNTHSNGVARECYAACSVQGQQDMGGCIGFQDPNGVQESCFFLAPVDGGGPDNGLGTPLTAEQMTQQASFADWDFVETWTICEGKDYPRLRWEELDCGE